MGENLFLLMMYAVGVLFILAVAGVLAAILELYDHTPFVRWLDNQFRKWGM